MTTIETDVLVLGSGPGGYSAAFRAADLGMNVTMVEHYQTLGGVCLNVGCIPSKALLHVAEVLTEAEHSEDIGITFNQPIIDLDKIRAFKDKTVSKLTQGVMGMAKGRKVNTVHGYGTFVGPHELSVVKNDEETRIKFKNAIIAAGSRPVSLPFIPDDPRIWDSTDALTLSSVPPRLLILGGGIIGLEMATIYQKLGSEICVVEFADQLIPAADKDLVNVYQNYNKGRFDVRLGTKVTGIDAKKDALYVTAEDSKGKVWTEKFDAALVAVGRKPNGDLINAAAAGLTVDERGFIPVDDQQRTNVPHIFGIGDIVGNPMLAHKATHEGHVAAEVIAGHKAYFAPLTIPSIAYTNPEVAWTGLTEKEAKEKGLNFSTAVFPWAASGRALGANRSEGKTKLIYNKDNGALLGGGIVGKNAGELLGELSLGIEFGAEVEDLALTIHAHPTLNETVGLAAELANGTITDLPNPKAVKKK
jgi:dihydrolipoamide dehydrogenase